MKKKTKQAVKFIDDLHAFLIASPQFRENTKSFSETRIQTELRPLIIRYLEEYFRNKGSRDPVAKANKEFYWEGEAGEYGAGRDKTFGARNYPDFIIKYPYRIAIEYKQSPNGSTVKQGIGQSIIHTLSGDFDFVYYLFHDQSNGKTIERSIENRKEQNILGKIKKDFNVFVYFV